MDLNAHLPAEVEEYLGEARRTWEFEESLVKYAKLYAVREVPVVTCTVSGKNYVPFRKAVKRDYSTATQTIIGCDLVAELRSLSNSPVSFYSGMTEQGVLMWFPQVSEFGTWEAARERVLLYPSVTWKDIVASPLDYILGAISAARKRIAVYTFAPWEAEHPDDERCLSLIARARLLQADTVAFPDALKAALMATESSLAVSEESKKMSNYVASRLIPEIRGCEDVVAVCDSLLKSLSLAPKHACALVNEAARFECNSGNAPAAIARLEHALTEKAYTDYHDRFQSILNHIKSNPPT